MKFSQCLAAASLLLTASWSRAAVEEGLKQGDTFPRCVQWDPISGHSYKPHCKEAIERAGQKSEMSYNAEGLRDKDYPARPQKSWTRILLVGDSRIVGPGIAESDDPARRLEHYLRGSNEKLEVINASVEGYGPLQQLTRLKRWIDAYSPTHVILLVEFQPAVNSDTMFRPYFHWDTRSIEMRILPWMKPCAFFMGLNDGRNYQKFRYAYSWQSAAYRALHTQYCLVFQRAPHARAACLAETTLDAFAEMERISAAAAAKFEVITSGANFSNELVVSPTFDAAAIKTWDSFTPHLFVSLASVAQQMRKRGIPFQAITPISSKALLLPGDYHFNKDGSDTYARSLALRLQAWLD